MSPATEPRAQGLVAFGTGAVTAAWSHVWLRWTALAPEAAGAPPVLVGAAVLATIAAGALAAGDGGARGPLANATCGTRLLVLAAVATLVSLALPHAGVGTPMVVSIGAVSAGAAVACAATRPGALLVGAGVGWALAGLGLPLRGISQTAWAASGATLALGASAFWVGKASAAGRIDALDPDAPSRPEPLVVVAAMALGAYSLLVHVSVVAYVGDSVYARSAFVALALIGPAIGIGVRTAARRVPDGVWIGIAAVGAVVAAMLFAPLEWIVPGVVRRLGGIASWPRALVLCAVNAAVLLFPVSVPLGAALGPSLRDARQFGWAMVGSSFGLLALALLAAWTGPPGGLGTAWVFGYDRGVSPFTQRHGPLLHVSSGWDAPVIVTDDPEQGRLLRLSDGRTLGGTGTDPEDRVTAEIPLLLHLSPRRILQLGFRAGNGASSILSHPVERLDVVDPTGAARDTAPFFEETNLDVVSDDRLVLHESDPWSFLERSVGRWDVIRLFADALEHAGGRDLPTRERLELARAHLADGGLVSLTLNVGRTSDDEIRSVLGTMLSVFPSVTVWDGPLGYTWTIVGSDTRLDVSPARLSERLRDPDVEAELAALGLAANGGLAERRVLDDAGARRFADDAPPIVTDRPGVDDASARSPYTFFGLGGTVADTPLADLTSPDGRPNAGLERLFDRLHRVQAIKEASRTPAQK